MIITLHLATTQEHTLQYKLQMIIPKRSFVIFKLDRVEWKASIKDSLYSHQATTMKRVPRRISMWRILKDKLQTLSSWTTKLLEDNNSIISTQSKKNISLLISLYQQAISLVVQEGLRKVKISLSHTVNFRTVM